MPINTWRGTCRFCGKKVGARKGWAGKGSMGTWSVWHQKCGEAPAKTPEEQNIEARRAARLPYAD